jgi:hypothetical protein
MIKDTEKYLNEHVNYEINMMEIAHTQCLNTQDQALWNMAMESFCVHARNCLNFLSGEGIFTLATLDRETITHPFDILRDLDAMEHSVFTLGWQREEGVKVRIERIVEVNDYVLTVFEDLEYIERKVS